MKKMNKKGFTLIELLAVIVILAIIMVIAVPQILSVIDNSRKNAWESNVKLIEEGIETNEAIIGVSDKDQTNGSKSVYNTSSNGEEDPAGCTQKNISKFVDIDTTATTLTIEGTPTTSECKVKVEAISDGKFSTQTAQIITCTKGSGCSHTNAQ